jgi:hypothetical protein
VNRPLGKENEVTKDGLPDLSVFSSRNDPNRGATRRLVFFALLLLGGASAAALTLRYVTGRGSALALPSLGLPSGLGMRGDDGPRDPPPISPEKLAEMQKSWIGSASIAPRNDKVDPATGERTGAFRGFGLQLDSAPQGATVVVNGEEMGTTPLLTTVDCVPGQPVEVSLVRGADGAKASTLCRTDTLVKLRLRLEHLKRR